MTRQRLFREEPKFAVWVIAEGTSMVGSSVSMVALPVLIYDLTGSAGLTGLLATARLLPYLVFGLIAGPIADRSSRRRLIIGGNIVEGVAVATIPLAAAFDVLSTTHVFVVAFVGATAFVFSDAAVFGAVPSLVAPERLAAANGMLSAIGSLGDIAGPVLAGVLIAAVGSATTLWVDAASFLIAAAVQSTIRSDFRRSSATAERPSIRGQLAAAFGFIRKQRTVATLTLVGFGNSLGIGTMLGLLVPYSVEVLGYASDDARLGVLYAAIGVGGLLAAVTFSRIFTTARVRVITPTMLAWSAVMSASFVIGPGRAAPLAVAAFSFGVMVTISTGITYRQLATPDSLVSTVNTIGRMIAAGGQPVGAAIGAGIAAFASVTTAYAAATAFLAISAIAAFLALRNQHPARLATND